MVDYCFQQNISFGACDTDNLLSDPESSCASADLNSLNSLLYLNFEEDPITEEMINNVCFSQNSNNSTCSTTNNQNRNQIVYNSSPYTSIVSSGRQNVEINGFNQPIVNSSITEPQFDLMANDGSRFAGNEINASHQNVQNNAANPLLSYLNHVQSNDRQTGNDLVRIQNECISMSPTSNTSTVSSNHTLPSFMDTYSSNKLNNTTVPLLEDEDCKTISNFTNSLQVSQANDVNQVNRTTMNSNLNNLNNNHLDDNHFDSDNLLYEFESPINQNTEFGDDQSFSNSSFTSVNLPTPPTTSAELASMTNCQSSHLFNLSASNCSSSLLINTPVSTPLNGLLSNCSSPISSIQESTFKPIKFKQEPITMEYDCNNNLIKQQSSAIYSSCSNLFANKTMNNVEANNSILYNEFNSFDVDLYTKTELSSTDELNNCLNGQSIMNLQPDHSMTTQQPLQPTFNEPSNRMTQQSQLFSNGTSANTKCITTLQPTNKRLTNTLLNVNQMNQPNKANLNTMYSQTNRLKFIRNQSTNLDSSAYKTKQMNQFTQQLNSSKYSANNKTSLVCLVCGDQANCCHYKVVTCEGCKGFFKRTVQKSAKYTCLGDKDCIVDKRRRNRCQYCRFQKCLSVGMIKEVVRTDSLKGRRGRLPSKAKFQNNVTNSSPSIEFIRPLLDKLIKNYPSLKKSKQTLYQNENDCLELSNNSIEFNEQFGSASSYNNGNDYLRNGQYSRQQIANQFKQIALQFTNNFAHQIPGFNELDENDRKSLITNSSLEVFCLFFAYRHAPGSAVYEFDENLRLSRSEVAKVFGQWFKGVEELMARLINLQIDLLSFTYLLSIVILYGYNDSNSEKVDKIQNKLVNSLKEFTDRDVEAQKKPSFFPKLINLLPDLKNLKSFLDDYQSNVPFQFY